jgi:hypothetical protein
MPCAIDLRSCSILHHARGIIGAPNQVPSTASPCHSFLPVPSTSIRIPFIRRKGIILPLLDELLQLLNRARRSCESRNQQPTRLIAQWRRHESGDQLPDDRPAQRERDMRQRDSEARRQQRIQRNRRYIVICSTQQLTRLHSCLHS